MAIHALPRRLLRAGMLLLMVLLLVADASAENENLLKNPGFEEVGSNGLPTFWRGDAWVKDEGISLYASTEDAARSGLRSGKIENFDYNDARLYQVVSVEPDSLYRLSGYVRTEGVLTEGGHGANLSVKDLFVFSNEVYGTTDEWTYVEIYGQTGPSQRDVTVYARLGGYSGENIGLAYFDDLELVKVNSVPAGTFVREWYAQEIIEVPDETEPSGAGESEAAWGWLLLTAVAFLALGGYLSEFVLREKLPSSLGKKGLPAFLLVGMGAALLLRLFLAWVVEGYSVDVNCFNAWGQTVTMYGLGDFYRNTGFCDYPPAYLPVMGLNQKLGEMLTSLLGTNAIAFAHRLVPIACDLVSAALVYRICVKRNGGRVQGGVLALLMALNPAIILNSAGWGQIDSVLCMLMLFVAYLAISEKWSVALPVYVLSVLVKPQALMLGFLGLAAILLTLAKAKPLISVQQGKKRWNFPPVWKKMAWGLLWSLLTALVILFPFVNSMGGLSWLFELYGKTLASYPYATVNTANLFYLFNGNWQSILYQAGTGVTVVFVALSLLWGVVTFFKRRDRRQTVLEPVITALLVAGLALTALGVMGLTSAEPQGYTLSMGNPWYVTQTESGYTRQLLANKAGAWAETIQPGTLLLLGAALLAAAGVLAFALNRRIRQGKRDKVHLGLVEPALMLLFTLVFSAMLIFDATWGALGTVAMALAFAVVLPMFIRSGKMETLPLCGAVLFMLLYVFGVKMHERYLFPAIFLLGMACAYHRDWRLLLVYLGMSATLFLNEGIILDNSIRLGAAMGHLNNDTKTLADCMALFNVLLTLFGVWTAYDICQQDARETLTPGPKPLLSIRAYRDGEKPCPPTELRLDKSLHWKKLDWTLMLSVTAVYAIVTLTTLGSTKAPQDPWISTTSSEQVMIDLGDNYQDVSMLYFCQVSRSDFSVAASPDGETWSEEMWAQMAEGQCYQWKYLVPCTEYNGTRNYGWADDFSGVRKFSGRYVRITAQQVGLKLNEVVFRDANGERIDATVIGRIGGNQNSPLWSDPQALLNEQDTITGEPGWWNGTYFDEIYHARTAKEHLDGANTYETSHPPLGKLLMAVGVWMFGMTPFGWRFMGAVMGILMLPAMYALGKQLTKKSSMAFAAMAMMTLDCMHSTQTRIATIDSYPVLFILLSWLFMLRFMQTDIVRVPMKKLLPDLALSGFFMGCGVASKWIGIYSGAGLAVVFFWTCFRHLRLSVLSARALRREKGLDDNTRALLLLRDEGSMKRVLFICLWCLLFFVAIPLVIYLLSYIPYFAYQAPRSLGEFLRLVWEAQEGMWNYHSTPGLGMDHAFYSPWYEWIFNLRPMYYASPSFEPEGWSYAIWCFGNPAVWTMGLVGMAYVLVKWARGHRYLTPGSVGTLHLYADTWDVTSGFLLIGAMAQFLPWVLVPRGTYIYHYFATTPFLMLAVMVMLNDLTRQNKWVGRIVTGLYLAVCLGLFVAYFPYASGVWSPNSWMDFMSRFLRLYH